jgi:hypothetical protein
MVTADEVERSLRGTIELLNQRREGLRSFDLSEAGFWRSFQAIWLTIPAFVVTFSFEHRRLVAAGIVPGPFTEAMLMLFIALCHVASFIALPCAMAYLARRLGLGARYVPFVIVTNWINVVSLTVLSVPATLMLLGWATPALAAFFGIAFAVVLLRIQWFATKVTLGVTSSFAFTIVALGLCLSFGIGIIQRAVIG